MNRDEEEAKRLLQVHRSINSGDHSSSSFGRLRTHFSSGPKPFTPQEINEVLSQVVDQDGSTGVVKALVDLGADVNFCKKRKSWGSKTKDTEIRNDILIRAAAKCRAETVYEIAFKSNHENLTSALQPAMQRGDFDVLQALLQFSPDPHNYHDEFLSLVAQNRIPHVHAILSIPHRLPCAACLSTGLQLAVKNGSLEITERLIQCRANVNHDEGAALLEAVEASRVDLVAALISGDIRPSPRVLDAALGLAHKVVNPNDESSPERDIIELCLGKGAAGPATTSLVTDGAVEAVQQRHAQLLDTILRLRRPPGKFEAAALIECIQTDQIDLLDRILEVRPSDSSLTLALSQAVNVTDRQLGYEFAEHLINGGAMGSCADEALVTVVNRIATEDLQQDVMAMDMQLFHLLLHTGQASVDYDNGAALQLAVQSLCIELAEDMLAKDPSTESLDAALRCALDITNASVQLTLTEMILAKKPSTEAQNAALSRALDMTDTRAQISMVETLMRHEVTEDAAGECLVEAFKDPQVNM